MATEPRRQLQAALIEYIRAALPASNTIREPDRGYLVTYPASEAVAIVDILNEHIGDFVNELTREDPEACPTCHNKPGDGIGCDDPNGCGVGL